MYLLIKEKKIGLALPIISATAELLPQCGALKRCHPQEGKLLCLALGTPCKKRPAQF